jgi:hypothetical protein
MTNSDWKTSVNELLSIFRQALLAVIPCIEKAHIRWKQGESYDEWDNITEALFSNIVCSSLAGAVLPEYSMARYDLRYKDYSNIDFILVETPNAATNMYIFVSYQTVVSPFDSVEVAEVNKDGKVLGYSTLDITDVTFLFVKRNGTTQIVLDEVVVPM